MDPWSLDTLLIVFGGGIVGTAFGPLWAFILCCTISFIGCLIIAVGGPDFVLLTVGLGPVFGPHVGGFAAGIAAATYAAGVKKNHPTGAAKDILSALVNTSWDVLFVGGIAALVGHTLLNLLAQVPIVNWGDVLALTVVIVCMLSRMLFQKEMPWGSRVSIQKNGYLGTDKGAISWVPWMSTPPKLAVIGLGYGLFSGAAAMMVQNSAMPFVEVGTVSATAAFIAALLVGWAFCGISLIALQLGQGEIQKVPVAHVISLLSALAFLYSGSIAIAGLTGVLAAYLQEIMARMFYNHGSNHIDPPACTAVVGGLFLNILFRPDLLGIAS